MNHFVGSLGARLYTRPQRMSYLAVAIVAAGALVAQASSRSALGLAEGVVQAALLVAVVAFGPAAMHVRLGENGVVVRNLMRTYRVPWSEVRGFTLDDRFPYRAYLDLADGREIPLHAITDEPWLAIGRAHVRNIEMLEALNGRWRQHVIHATTGGTGVAVADAS